MSPNVPPSIPLTEYVSFIEYLFYHLSHYLYVFIVILQKEPSLNLLVPEDPNKPYDMHEVIKKVVDDGDFFEIHPGYAKNILVGFARMDGRTVGIVANQPKELAGIIILHID